MKRLISILAALIATLSQLGSTAELELQVIPSGSAYIPGSSYVRIILSGNIQVGDYENIKRLYHEGEVRPDPEHDWLETASLVLLSHGGDVREAMRIGRWMRRNNVGAWVGPDMTCYSSCVYLLAAGLTRTVIHGEVGIHRPYYLQLPHGDLAADMKQLLIDSRKFFEDMNVPGELAEAMFSTPPEKMRILNDRELSQFRLNQTDMVYQEKLDFLVASDYGLSRVEYLARRAAFERDFERYCNYADVSEVTRCSKHYEEVNGLILQEETHSGIDTSHSE